MSSLTSSKMVTELPESEKTGFIPARQLVSVARSAAMQAGEYLLERYGKLFETDVNEKAKNDFVTYVDTASEKIIVNTILEAFPRHSILSEESRAIETGSRYQWIIDPLDGTRNFIQKIPYYAISIAVAEKDRLVAGLVLDPVRGEIYHAIHGEGAFLNGHPISVSGRTVISNAIIGTGFPHRRKEILTRYLSAFEEIFRNCSDLRRIGAAALDLCYVACGRMEGFFEAGLSPWDMAAGALIVEEAGGKVSDFRGHSNHLNSGFITAGNPTVHAEIIEILSRHFNEDNSI